MEKTVSPTQHSLVACISLCRVGASALSPIHVNLSLLSFWSAHAWVVLSVNGGCGFLERVSCVLKKEVSLTEVWTTFICGYIGTNG